ncbi:hypothetical protein ABW19_dt0208014 [Dactylella cylindrospora]|nr:hypothetical protein ABW19_dt0208014 [Dactylella cylindrospora]
MTSPSIIATSHGVAFKSITVDDAALAAGNADGVVAVLDHLENPFECSPYLLQGGQLQVLFRVQPPILRAFNDTFDQIKAAETEPGITWTADNRVYIAESNFTFCLKRTSSIAPPPTQSISAPIARDWGGCQPMCQLFGQLGLRCKHTPEANEIGLAEVVDGDVAMLSRSTSRAPSQLTPEPNNSAATTVALPSFGSGYEGYKEESNQVKRHKRVRLETDGLSLCADEKVRYIKREGGEDTDDDGEGPFHGSYHT